VVEVVQDLHHQHLPYQVVLVVVEVETLPVEVLETLEDLLNQKEIQVVMVDILLIRHNMMVAAGAVQVVQEQLHQDKEVDQEDLVDEKIQMKKNMMAEMDQVHEDATQDQVEQVQVRLLTQVQLLEHRGQVHL
jgi:uncharacterized protein YcbK (DUF882 family)